MIRTCALGGVIVALGALAGAAEGSYTITQSASPAPTYSTTLNFDEPGTPTGLVPDDTWLESHCVLTVSGDSQSVVDDFSVQPGQSWLGTGNSYTGAFGVFLTFTQDVTEFSAQFWDPSGAPSPFGGGAGIFILNDGVEVASMAFTPAWGGVGDSWLNVTTADGMVFDEVRVLGFGFFPTTFMDNASWNKVPAPGAVALFGLAGAAGLRRRRA